MEVEGNFERGKFISKRSKIAKMVVSGKEDKMPPTFLHAEARF